MRWLLVLLASCVSFGWPPVEHPAGTDEASCHLAPPYQGALSWVETSTELQCTAQNKLGAPREVCFEPYVGVRETGAVYTSHEMVCSDELAEGASQLMTVRIDMRRELCQLQRGGCIVKAFTLDHWWQPDVSAVVALARGLEAQATEPGRDKPTVAECEGLVRLAPRIPDDTIAMCLNLSRAELACFAAAPDAKAAQACSPRMP